jgi:hypothetical protein
MIQRDGKKKIFGLADNPSPIFEPEAYLRY